jgi:hypothetical protein
MGGRSLAADLSCPNTDLFTRDLIKAFEWSSGLESNREILIVVSRAKTFTMVLKRSELVKKMGEKMMATVKIFQCFLVVILVVSTSAIRVK